MDTEKYIPRKYGICESLMTERKCVCRQKGYAQEMCHNYRSVTLRSWEEMAEYAKTHLYPKEKSCINSDID